MTMMQAVSAVFEKYATFSGRARRSEYWYYFLFNVIVGFAMFVITGVVGAIGVYAYFIYALAVFIPSLAVLCRRLHDTGTSGVWLLLLFIPVVNLIGLVILFVCLVQDGEADDNKYGPNPKRRASSPVAEYYGYEPQYEPQYTSQYTTQYTTQNEPQDTPQHEADQDESHPEETAVTYKSCSHCGSSQRDNARFCTNCGEKMEDAPAT